MSRRNGRKKQKIKRGRRRENGGRGEIDRIRGNARTHTLTDSNAIS
jgi:hypothetical protein